LTPIPGLTRYSCVRSPKWRSPRVGNLAPTQVSTRLVPTTRSSFGRYSRVPLATGFLQCPDPASVVGSQPQCGSTPPRGHQSHTVIEASSRPWPDSQDSPHSSVARDGTRSTGARGAGPTALSWLGHCRLTGKRCAHGARMIRSKTLGDLLDYARKSRPSVRHLLASTRTRSFYSKEREEGVRLAVVGCE